MLVVPWSIDPTNISEGCIVGVQDESIRSWLSKKREDWGIRGKSVPETSADPMKEAQISHRCLKSGEVMEIAMLNNEYGR